MEEGGSRTVGGAGGDGGGGARPCGRCFVIKNLFFTFLLHLSTSPGSFSFFLLLPITHSSFLQHTLPPISSQQMKLFLWFKVLRFTSYTNRQIILRDRNKTGWITGRKQGHCLLHLSVTFGTNPTFRHPPWKQHDPLTWINNLINPW